MLQLETEQRDSVRDWPAQVELIMSALDTGQFDANRRKTGRVSYRVKAKLRLFSDPAMSSPWIIYTRDIHARGLGFISPHRLPLGYGGLIELPGPQGGVININCTLSRCREAAPGWYEGSLYFNRELAEFVLPAEELESSKL
jgi:hypothetical protein